MEIDDDHLTWSSAGELAQLIQQRRVSSQQLVGHFVRRIEALDDAKDGINAVVVRCFDHALRRARAADEATARGESWGPLHGVPLTVKESLSVAGVVTSSALHRLKEYVRSVRACGVPG